MCFFFFLLVSWEKKNRNLSQFFFVMIYKRLILPLTFSIGNLRKWTNWIIHRVMEISRQPWIKYYAIISILWWLWRFYWILHIYSIRLNINKLCIISIFLASENCETLIKVQADITENILNYSQINNSRCRKFFYNRKQKWISLLGQATYNINFNGLEKKNLY